ncbi:MAG: GxxExxY protein [Acidobacteriaceae bacterium]
MNAQQVSRAVLTAEMKVHTKLGPGLLESTYEACLAYELRKAGLHCETQVPLPVVYDGMKLDVGYRIDLLAQDVVIVELKSVEVISPVHQAQIISYLKLSNRSLGLLINFNVVHLRNSIKSFVTGQPGALRVFPLWPSCPSWFVFKEGLWRRRFRRCRRRRLRVGVFCWKRAR